jgi:hypothetical protein
LRGIHTVGRDVAEETVVPEHTVVPFDKMTDGEDETVEVDDDEMEGETYEPCG